MNPKLPSSEALKCPVDGDDDDDDDADDVLFVYWLWQIPSLAAAAADGDEVVDADDVEVSCGNCDVDVRYRELYSRCWHTDRDLRPSAAQLVDILLFWSSAA